jgi:subtilisin family serine protease
VQVSNLELAALLRKMLDNAGTAGGLDVVNLSIFYDREGIGGGVPGGLAIRPRGDPVLDVIRDDGHETLFVVAAGNDGDDFTAICDLRPACIDLPNVISVAALDGSASDVALLRSGAGATNYGSRVHVAAPGTDVLSLANGNYLGLLSGTSQATPQVAAVASILRTLMPKASPGDVKERLITCSRELPRPAGAADSSTNEVFGGRIDSACTLAPDGEGLLEEKDAKGSYRVRALKPGAKSELIFEAVSGDYIVAIPARQLRGLRASVGNPEELTVFFKRSPENVNAQLSREEQLSVKPDVQIMVEVWDDRAPGPAGWKTRTFQVSKIARFVAPMWNR